MKIVRYVIQFLIGSSKQRKQITPKQKKQRALEHINQLKEHYELLNNNKEISSGDKIRANMNSLQLMVIEASILTNKIIVSDNLLLELEKVIFLEV